MLPKQAMPQQLLVEGSDDQHVVWQLCEHHQLPETFSVELPGRFADSGGIGKHLRDIPARLKSPDLRTLGVVIDANGDPAMRWRQVASAIPRDVSIAVPPTPILNGWIGATEEIRIGVWLMPDNSVGGMLEDFVVQLIPSDDPLLIKARGILSEIESDGLQRYIPNHQSKALIHTWLAWQQDPGRPMGTAIKAGYLQYDAPSALAFVSWLRRHFDLGTAPGVV